MASLEYNTGLVPVLQKYHSQVTILSNDQWLGNITPKVLTSFKSINLMIRIKCLERKLRIWLSPQF